MQISRRGLITGLVSLVAAPAIVRASSLMPVKAWRTDLPGPVRFMSGDVLERSGRNLTATEVRQLQAAFFARVDEAIEAQLAPRRDAFLQAIQRHLEAVPSHS